MLKVTTTISVVVADLQQIVNRIKEPDKMLRNIASTLTGVIRDRVHTQGKASDGEQIGTYSESYMKVRTGNYGNSGRISKGKNKGEVKNAGVFSKGPQKGQARPKYNRTNDTKVVISLTRQQENDLGTNVADPVKTEGGYGIGFKNPENWEKSQHVEKLYKKPIWNLTKSEETLVQQIAEKYTEDAITGENS